MEDVKQYLDCELYQVEKDEDGHKVVHIDGYIFDGGEEGLQLVQFTDVRFRLIDTDSWKYEDFMDVADCCNQYQGEISVEDAVKYYEKATPTPLCCLSEETPCGWYVNTFKNT